MLPSFSKSSTSTLAQGYLVGLGTIVVMENGSESAKNLLPKLLKDVFEFKSNGIKH